MNSAVTIAIRVTSITFGFAVLIAAAGQQPAEAAALPRHKGECSVTTVKQVETRLENTLGSGSAISYENGGYQVSYDTVAAVEASRPGDEVKLCLVFIPHPCPPKDTRGRRYRATNMRTHGSWTFPDAEHACGGA